VIGEAEGRQWYEAGAAASESIVRAVLYRDRPPDTGIRRVVDRARRLAGEGVRRGWETLCELGAVGPDDARGRRFGSFGEGSIVCFPFNTIFNEQFIHIGRNTMIGPQSTLSAGMVPGQQCLHDAVVRIGDRCLIGKGSGIVGHFEIVIGDDVWTGHHVYITDQNHGYEDIGLPISKQSMPERPVVIGDGSWLGHGTVVLPGARIGRHVVVGANSVVTSELPDFSVAVGSPARVVKRYDDVKGWISVD
jgi:acetyltransferase-like isoleucine patch superfamily enzyme